MNHLNWLLTPNPALASVAPAFIYLNLFVAAVLLWRM